MKDLNRGFSPSYTGRGHLAMVLIVALLAGLVAAPFAAFAQPAPAAVAADLDAIKPELRGDVAAAMPEGMPVYELGLTFPTPDDHSSVLRGTLALTYTNTTGETLSGLPFRLYANGPAAGHDAITIEEVTIDAAAVMPEWSVANSVATVPLPSPLAPDARVTIAMRFTTHVPEDSGAHYGILNRASRTGTWALAHWYPVLAGRDPQDGWMLDAPSQNGDPVFSDMGVYHVTVTAPEALQLITSGVERSTETLGDGMRTTSYSAAPSRDFTIVADADMVATVRDVDGTTVTSWYEPGRDEAGEAAADWAAQALALFNELLGEYPYRHLQLVQVEIFGAAGVEFPQLLYIGSSYYDRPVNREEPSSFEFTVAHEVVHQWFYGLVGNNQYRHAFIDEGLTNYLSSQVYFDRMQGERSAQRVVDAYLVGPFERDVRAGNDQVVDRPTDDFSQQGYVMAAYSKAPLGFAAIHDAMGDEAFFGALQAYVRGFRFRVATPDDLCAAFEAASDQDVRAIWIHWFEERNGEQDLSTAG